MYIKLPEPKQCIIIDKQDKPRIIEEVISLGFGGKNIEIEKVGSNNTIEFIDRALYKQILINDSLIVLE